MAFRRRRGDHDFLWNDDNFDEMYMFGAPRYGEDCRNQRYSEAYGNYRGGYGPRRPEMGFMPGPNIWPRQSPPTLMGECFRPVGPPPPKRFAFHDQAIDYLTRCGVAKEDLKDLTREVLQLMEPQYCGICAQGFDSFQTSRIHYISKNHLKCQKRWLTQSADPAKMSQKEAPLKSRELYCELCDVHMTSKPLAESHYAGKPHRAIVEGRKNPKNVRLLDRSMQKRLELLLRREKRIMKAIVESTAKEAEEKEPKVLQPDLYCEICKASVTCAEQMTSHLNGKRHLKQEKQHIMNMIKEGISTDIGKDESETDAGPKEGSTETVVEHAQEESFDWDNGGSNWDEPTKQ